MNTIYKINNCHTLLYRSTRKLIWFSVPDLKIMEKYYTKSSFIHINTNGTIMVVDRNCLSFLTLEMPPLQIVQFQKQFLDWQPIGGFSLGFSVVLYNKHSIYLYDKGQSLKQTWSIDVVQTIQEIKYSQSQNYIGMKVLQKQNTIYVWNLGDISTKTSQQIVVFDDIIKWEFYLQDILIVMTKSEIRAYCPENQRYNIQFYFEIEQKAIDFCFLERPKVNKHSGRRSVYPLAVLGKQGEVYIYQLYDMDKRLKNSLASLISTIKLDKNTKKIKAGFENEYEEIVFICQGLRDKPVTYVLNEKYFILKRYDYQPELDQKVQSVQYSKKIVAAQTNKQQQSSVWKVSKLVGKQQTQSLRQINAKILYLGLQYIYAFTSTQLSVYNLQNQQLLQEVQFKCPGKIYLLMEVQHNAFFVAGIKVYKYNHKEKTMKATSFIVKNDKFKLQQVNMFTKSLLYKMGSQYILMEYRLQGQKIATTTIKSSPNTIMSLRNGKWAQLTNTSITIGNKERVLVVFDLQKFFRTLTQDNILYEYSLHWTTHDGIILIVKNYIFILQLIQSSEGYSLNVIKKMLNYFHHRLDPDSQIIQIVNPRQFVIRSGNRVVRLGSKLNHFISQDPFALPDTLLQRQLQMRKYYPPHHPKIIGYLIQMGSFSLLSQIFKNIKQWIVGDGKIVHLYKRIGIQFYEEYNREKDQQFITAIQGQEQQIQALKGLCQNILQQPYKLQLQENGALILQSQIQSMVYRVQNSRSMDYFSSIVLMQQRLPSKKNKAFKSLQIAYLMHSINKDEAISILKPQKIEWSWITKFSIIFWYDNKEQIKKWIQEIGANQYRKQRQPFDCLFWYTLIGKKNLLMTLFKKHQFNSKQHEGIFKFLQRDFSVPKNQSAAIKNAYALVDKKRYIHALSFFIYGNKYEQALSLCLNKIKDMNLALLICILSNYEKTKIYQVLQNEGDIWTKHISNVLKGKHILSFNCLFQNIIPENWDYMLQLSGFRPCVKTFAEMIQKSIPVKRQLQQQKYKQSQSQNIFDSFYPQFDKKEEEQGMTNINETHQLISNYPQLQVHTVEFYIRNNCPLLALMIDKYHKNAIRAYQLQQFMLTKRIQQYVYELAQEMEDIISIITTKLQNQEKGTTQLLHTYKDNMLQAISKIALDVTIHKNKENVGKLLYLCYYCEKIMKMKDSFELQEQVHIIQKQLPLLSAIGQIILCLQLQNYELLQSKIKRFIMVIQNQKITYDDEQEQEQWVCFKTCYGKLSSSQLRKNKTQKLLDTFEYSLYRYKYRRNKENVYENYDPKIPQRQAIVLKLNKEILTLIINILSFKQCKQVVDCLQIINRKLKILQKKWMQADFNQNLERQLNVMYNEGTIAKLKVNYFSQLLDENFESVCQALCNIKFENAKTTIMTINLQQNKSNKKDRQNSALQAIQIFRNKQDGPKEFTINKNEGSGMQIVVMFKKGTKKLQVCESLVNRNRTHDGYYVTHEDTLYNISSNLNFDNIFDKKYPPLVQNAVKNVLQNRKQYQGKGLIKGSTKRGDTQFLRQLDPLPFLDINELNSIECHHFLPVFLLGGKGQMHICNFSTLKNYNKIKCPGMSDIVKIASFEQRVLSMDGSGNLGCYNFDSKISGNCVFNLKKAGVVDFCMISPTVYGVITNNNIQVYDTLLHPKRQNIFKIQLSQQPHCITSFLDSKIAVGRKSELLFYDIRMDIQQETRDIESKVKCLSSCQKNKILVGRNDGRVKVVDVYDKNKDYQIKCCRGVEQKQKVGIERVQIMGESALTLSNEGSIFLIDKL